MDEDGWNGVSGEMEEQGLCEDTHKARKINDSLAFFRPQVTPGGELR
jgi:hypothetical protein